MAFALQAKGAYKRIIQVYATAEQVAEAARPGCTICEVPDTYCSNLEQRDTQHLLEYIDSIPSDKVIRI